MSDEKDREAPTTEQIAIKAFERYCARGCEDGYDVDDWLAAEAELTPQEQPAQSEPQLMEGGKP